MFRIDEGGEAAALHLDLAPGLERERRAFLARRADASLDATDPQHALVVEARVQLVRGERATRTALGDRACAQAFQPLLDDDGEVRGFVYLEFEHLRVPSRAALRELGDGLEELLGPRPPRRGSTREPGTSAADPEAFFAPWIEALAPSARRRVLGFEFSSGLAREVFRSVTDGEAEPGGARCLERLRRSAGPVRFDEPDAGFSLLADSGSGFCVPVISSGRLIGAVAAESARSGAFPEETVAQLGRLAGELAPAFRLDQFSRWHREQHGVSLYHELRTSSARAEHDAIVRLARTGYPRCVSGAPGSGKRTLARALWFEGERPGHPPVVRVCARETAARELERACEETRDGTLILEQVEELHDRAQKALAGRLAAVPHEASPCVIVVVSKPLEALRADLALLLSRARLETRPLADRREEIPGLTRFFARRVAEQEGLAPVELTEEALNALWRQDHAANLRELESVVTRIVLAHDGGPVGEEAVRLALGERYRSRLDSREPRRRDVLAALFETRTRSGRMNKTRAAALLGWDPDTLAARLRDLELEEEELARL